jgi:CHAT domain-containing protein/tetratricopeptide (TPR) repeat protein
LIGGRAGATSREAGVIAGVALALALAAVSFAAPGRSSRADLEWANHASREIRRQMIEGRYTDALPLVERQLAIRRRWLGNGTLEVARSLDTLARLEYEQGQFEHAYEHEREALRVRETRLGKHHLEVAESVEQLGRIIKAFGVEGDDAMPLYQRALRIRLDLEPPDHPDIAGVRMRIANLQRMRREWGDAEKNFALALAARRKSLGPGHPEVAITLSEFALMLVSKGDWERAEGYAREALVLQRRNPLRLMQDYTVCLNLNAQILARRGRYAAAESLLVESAAIREAGRQEARPGSGRSRMYQMIVYLDLASVQVAQGKGEEGWASLEKALGRVLTESLSSAAAPRRRSGSVAEAPAIPLARVQAALEPDAALVGWFETRRGGGAIVSNRWAYVLRSRGPIRWTRLDRDSATEARFFFQRRRYGGELNAAGAWPLRVTGDAALRMLARAWGAHEIDPILPNLRGVRRLIVVSPDILAGVPVESWLAADGHYVSERFVVSYAPSAAWYVRLRDRQRHRPADRWNALLIGDPELSRETTLGAQAVARAQFDAQLASDLAPGTNATAAMPEVPTFAPLPRARTEVLEVSALLPRATVLLGARASEEELDRLAGSGALAKYDLIHLATHAVIDGRRPEKSALLLAGFRSSSPAKRATNDRSSAPKDSRPPRTTSPATGDPIARGGGHEIDGWLTADEISQHWRIDAELVSLSACRTGTGLTTRAEGTLGLNQAMLAAGAHSLLVSLWEVDDTAQSLLVGRFYENLTGKSGSAPRMSKAEALTEAKNWLRQHRDARGRTPFAHPAYWASFVLIGDPL